MKNLLCLHKKTDIYDYVTSKFRSDYFKTGGIARRMYEENILWFCENPRIFCEYSNEDIERYFFYSWFNILPERHGYEKPLMHDLHYLHEMTHMCLSDDQRQKDIKYTDWRHQTIQNEITASLFTEAEIFCGKIGKILRADCFDHEIWVDQHKNNESVLKQLRYQAYVNPKTTLDYQFANYMQNNYTFCDIWRIGDEFQKTENILYYRKHLPAEDQNDFLIEFLEKHMDANDYIPFKDNAIRFKQRMIK